VWVVSSSKRRTKADDTEPKNGNESDEKGREFKGSSFMEIQAKLDHRKRHYGTRKERTG